MRVRLFCFGLLLTFCAALRGQEVRGVINGTVDDPSGAMVSGAKIQVTNMDTGVVAGTTTTNVHGFYQISFLLPGNYSVTAESTGFKKSTVLAFGSMQARMSP